MRDYLLIVASAFMGVIGYAVAGSMKKHAPRLYWWTQLLAGGVLLTVLVRACRGS